VAGDREQVDVELSNADRDLAERLRGVGVNERARSVRESGELFDRLQHTGLVVRVHDRDERRVPVDGFTGGVHACATISVDADASDAAFVLLEPRARARSRRMLDDRRDDVALPLERLRHTTDGEVVRLRAARREHDLVGVAAEERRDLLPRLGDRRAGARAVHMPARGVAEVLAQVRQHRGDDLGQERRRRVVVEVDRVVRHGRDSGLSAANARNAAPGA
jgi:hypothetical protein